jgi:hypothetical protein
MGGRVKEVLEMNICPEYKEILFLDIYGELDSISRSKWQAHLKGCAVCKKEHARMTGLVGRVREIMTPPPLAPPETRSLIRAARAEMIHGEERTSRASRLSRHWRFSPALATACVFAAMISIWSLGTFDSFLNKDRSPGKDHWQGLRAEEVEIIRNFDLLKQMDSVEKLVHTLDEPEDDRSVPEVDSKTQGMTNHEKRVHYS